MTCPFCEKEHAVIVPSISLNGTSAQDLLAQTNDFACAIQEAIRIADLKANPNARDYPNFSLALTEHRERYDALQKISSDLYEIQEHIQAVIDYKERARREPRSTINERSLE